MKHSMSIYYIYCVIIIVTTLGNNINMLDAEVRTIVCFTSTYIEYTSHIYRDLKKHLSQNQVCETQYSTK